jgi:hypothetical protein
MNPLTTTDESRRAILDVGIPLHDETDSAADVAGLVGTLLNDIAGYDGAASHADILQALAITTAVRLAVAETAAMQPSDAFTIDLIDVEVGTEPVRQARPV